MALGTITILKRFRYPWAGGYGFKDMLIEITGDGDYPTGGSEITAAMLNVNSIIAIVPQRPHPLVNRRYLWNRTTGKLLGQVAAGTEVVASTNCSADKIVAKVYAR